MLEGGDVCEALPFTPFLHTVQEKWRQNWVRPQNTCLGEKHWAWTPHCRKGAVPEKRCIVLWRAYVARDSLRYDWFPLRPEGKLPHGCCTPPSALHLQGQRQIEGWPAEVGGKLEELGCKGFLAAQGVLPSWCGINLCLAVNSHTWGQGTQPSDLAGIHGTSTLDLEGRERQITDSPR